MEQLKCPNCKSDMEEVKEPSITFYRCKEYGGVFLDKGEIETMNIELEELNKNKQSQEYRGYIDNRLVRLDKIKDVAIGAVGPITYPQNIFFDCLYTLRNLSVSA